MNLDDAPVFGSPGPMAGGVDAPFWEGLAAGELRLQRCAACRTWYWAPQWRCGGCGSWEMSWETVPPVATVYCWIRTRHAFTPEMQRHLPFVTVLGELEQAGRRRVLGMLVGAETGLAVGAPLEAVIQPPSEATQWAFILRWRLRSH